VIRDAASNINLKLRWNKQASRMERENCTYILTEKPVGKRACRIALRQMFGKRVFGAVMMVLEFKIQDSLFSYYPITGITIRT